ncbi:MAG: acetyl-CoA hydrolase/transferase C-terminal domain-containing protein, partial [Halioglobus sp.]|nr:acetyl-CoA hydrolase/transferase C-terminal domain-containing protein [Halioglobus sp.]
DAGARKVVKVAQVHSDLPFMEHDAELPADVFDIIVDNPDYDRALFAVPNGAVPLRDYAAALHASQLVVDGGTLQIGIGALGDAVAQACILRQRDNDAYGRLLAAIGADHADAQSSPFEQGLYVSTEMFVYGMMRLVEEGIVKRRVYDDLELQNARNAGAIGDTVDSELYRWALDTGYMPRHLDAQSLARLQHWGIVDEAVTLAGASLDIAGQHYPNDLREQRTADALLAQVQGGTLRHGRYLHGGFFLGPREFYERLRALDDAEREAICMTGVRRTNQLLLDFPLYSAQRRDARFINTGMKVTLSGAVASDALEDGTVISGVGGQYNFVAMAHDLPGARSVLCIRSTRGQGDALESNIVARYGHATIPRHLRDIVVTEYGVADLRGQSDAEVIKRLVAVADSRFQEELLQFAREHGKLESDYELPQSARNNTPQRLADSLAPFVEQGLLPDYPFGTELTDREVALAASLRRIKSLSGDPAGMVKAVFRALLHREDEESARPWLERIHLEHPETPKEFLVQQLLLLDLEDRGLLKVR